MTDFPRLIEHAFPLKQASLDSVHEKNVRHGHISTLHIWPARRPLAACRAALIATLLPDPSATPKPEGMTDEAWQKEIQRRRQELCEKIGGKVVKRIERKKMPNGQIVEREREETVGGILHWGRETENADTLEWFRQEIRKAYGGLPAPRPGLFFVYVIECENGSHYIGHTDDLQRRWQEHLMGQGAEWTKRHKPKHIAHYEEFGSREEAVKRESDLKTGFGRKWLKELIASGRARQAGRAPKVLDPFAGGGAIPLEAMRLGCEATAIDINPVAWFILKCTLEYPQRLAGQTRPLPEFILHNDAFMAEFFKKAKGLSKAEVARELKRLGLATKSNEQFLPGFDDAETRGRGDTGKKKVAASPTPRVSASLLQADLAWHVRAWGQWVLDRARRELAQFYPTYADFEPLVKDNVAYEHQPMRLVPLKEDGTPDIESLNAEFTQEYLADKRNPRWVAKPTVAYLWARTVTCKNCRATVPLLKTRWLCKKANKRVLLTMEPNANRTGVVFGVDADVPAKGGNAAQKREHDKRLGAGTMSRAGAQCPCCGTINTMEDIRLEGKAQRLGSVMTAVVVDTPDGKAYRLPTEHELAVATPGEEQVQAAFKDVPFGVPDEPTPAGGGSGAGRAFSVQGYGLMKWRDLFTPRQLTALGTFVSATRAARDEMTKQQIPAEWLEAVGAYLAVGVDRQAAMLTTLCRWEGKNEFVVQTFARFALPILWDFAHTNLLSDTTGSYAGGIDWIARYVDHALLLGNETLPPRVRAQSAAVMLPGQFDAIVTDPPYYDAIPYSDLMDFFYVLLRRAFTEASDEVDRTFLKPLSPKWDHEANDGELIDDSSRHGNNAAKSKQAYEDGMAVVFKQCANALVPEGRLVIVFANKQPDAWETLVAAIIRAGFTVDGSWPIETERQARARAHSSAALASSVWLVCKKRPKTARPGWDNNVLDEMKANIAVKLREFWDAGIRGPDFVWAATGPALEAYSKHPVVRKANEPNATMGVGEFLNHVRRMVVDYVIGQVLSGEDAETRGRGDAAIGNLDEVTAYYLLHRHDFGLDEAPVGACILYATACGLSDAELERTWNILTRTGGDAERGGRGDAETDDFAASSRHRVSGSDDDDDDSQEDDDESPGTGSTVKLKPWNQRQHKSMGYEAPGGRVVPLIDRIHRVMHLWKDGDVQKVDEYLDQYALRRNELFKRVVQSLIELSTNSERSLLESISNHIGAKGAVKDRGPMLFSEDDAETR